jgi:uncharacterized protein (DUF1697 family)
VEKVSDTNSARLKPFVALLRAVNLAGRNRVPMAELRGLVEELGGQDVETYVQSGNVVFRSRMSADGLAEAIHAELEQRLGLDVAVLVRTSAELAKVVAKNPFASPKVDDKALHVAFLARTPTRARVRELDPTFAEPDLLHVAGREVFLLYPNGYGRTRLTNAVLERRLGVAATTRNWRTVTTLATMAAERQ